MAISPDRITARFSEIVAALPRNYSDCIRRRQNEKKTRIIVDEAEIDRSQKIYGKITTAAEIGGLFYFRPSRITEEVLDKVLLHEMMHLYIEDRDGLTYRDFQRHALLSPGEISKIEWLRFENEKEAIKLTTQLMAKLRLGQTREQ